MAEGSRPERKLAPSATIIAVSTNGVMCQKRNPFKVILVAKECGEKAIHLGTKKNLIISVGRVMSFPPLLNTMQKMVVKIVKLSKTV